ncbi:phosphatidylglycerophosphatase A [Nitrincola alkalilacustris]|uniref:phosphatidylglycerophosphatase A family protein n=1 Tax=Nitrincola alkalilacustris TaxID=1571224 RepID=UPI00124E8A6D|nr:phosphatidylglycerophosphatase A [Nitrincola alkalilacustris]
MSKTPASVWRNPIHFIAFGFGSGASPKAPGTVGTLAAIPLWLLLVQLPLTTYLLILLAAFAIGVWICQRTSDDIGVHDHGGIVWDEFVGFWITMIAVPAHWLWILIGFALFRLFDIWKPWPIGWVDKRVKGGMGIMLDDVIAGIYAAILIQIGLFLFA